MAREVITDNGPYTEMEHHEDALDPAATGDPSRPQGRFWHQNERPGADAFMKLDLEELESDLARKAQSGNGISSSRRSIERP